MHKNTHSFSDFNELNQLVDDNGDIITVTMEELRNAHGVSRLGVYVRDAISNELYKKGLSHIPEELPSYQHECVRVYRSGSQAGVLIKSILSIYHKDEINKNYDNDQHIKEVVDADARDKLKKIRELVCE